MAKAKTEEQLKMPKFFASVIVMNKKGKVLLGIRTEDGIATPPGGHAQDHETASQTALRELFEETAIHAKEEDLVELPTIDTVHGKVCHCYLLEVKHEDPIPDLDPDKEVKKWHWYHEDELPPELRKDPRRFESVRNAFMKFHGVMKGGPGSGPKPGRIQKQPWDESTKDTPEYDVRLAQKKEAKLQAQLDKLKAEYKATYGKDYVAKGGEGSGVKGHTTQQQLEIKGHGMKLVNLADKLIETNPFKELLHKLENGAVFEGHELRSGKPMYLDVNQAMAHGYTPDDYKEAGSFHYEKAQSMSNQIDKIKALGKEPPAEMGKIVKFHQKQFKQNFNMAEKTHKRMADTEAALKDRKADLNAKAREAQSKKNVKKSVVMLGYNDSAEVDTGKFSQEHSTDLSYWEQKIYAEMMDYNYGDAPRTIAIDKGVMHLVKVDDGMYTGHVTLMQQIEGETMVDNAKVRIERMSVPSLSQFLLAKEYVLPNPVSGGSPTNNNATSGAGDMALAQPEKVEALNESLMLEPMSESAPTVPSELQPPQLPPAHMIPGASIDQKIRMLELIDKLLG